MTGEHLGGTKNSCLSFHVFLFLKSYRALPRTVQLLY